MKNVVDSSAWLEYFSDGPNAELFSSPINNRENLIVPTIVLYEVFKVVLREKDENVALQIIASMQQGSVIELTTEIAIQAAKFSIEYKIPMADSLILATGHLFQAEIWTQDIDFKDIPGTRYCPKK